MVTKISVNSTKKDEFINITRDVQIAVTESNVKHGICYIHIPHTTAAVTVNEGADPDVVTDILTALNKLSPQLREFRHMEGNSDAHVKSSLVGISTSVFIENGTLLLGTWQAIYFCEFDGPRNRSVQIKIIEE